MNSPLSVPDRLPILEKRGRVNNVPMRYAGLSQDGQPTEYTVNRTVASVLTNGKFAFANAPYAYYTPTEVRDGWQVFEAPCGEASIPLAEYNRLLSVNRRTTGRKGGACD